MSKQSCSYSAEFTHIEWTSDAVRGLWKNRVAEAALTWKKIEVMSVAKRVRNAALLVCNSEEMLMLPRRLASYSLAVVPLAACAPTRDYQAQQVPPDVDGRVNYRVVVARVEMIDEFAAAWDSQDDDHIGQLLGFPECCRRHFIEVWNHQHKIDPTWNMAVHSDGKVLQDVIEVGGHDEANILLRWLGIRAVAHLPCCFDCDLTMRAGQDFLGLGAGLGLCSTVDTIREMLSWPVEWSASEGRAEIQTPIAKIVTKADPTDVRRIVRRKRRTHDKVYFVRPQ